MKKLICLCSGLYLTLIPLLSQTPSVNVQDSVQVPWEQQMSAIFQHVNLSSVTSHVLIDRGFQLCPIDQFTPTTADTSDACTFSAWQRLYGTLFSAAWEQQYRLPDPEVSYLSITNGSVEGNPIPIAIIDYNYHQLDSLSVQDNLLSVSNNQLYDVPNRARSPFLLRSCFAATPSNNVIHSLNAQFVFRSDLMFSNTGRVVSSLQVDFSDGAGLQNAQWNAPITINYSASGIRYIKTRITFSDNSIVEGWSKLEIKATVASTTGRYLQHYQDIHFVGSRPFNGNVGGCTRDSRIGLWQHEVDKTTYRH